VIPREKVVNALRTLKFSFKRQTDRVEMYKQNGTTLRVQLSKRSMLDVDYAKCLLRSAGMAPEKIEQFIRETDEKVH